jgi:hypothetical protein
MIRMVMIEMYCCQINCVKKAEWEIKFGDKPDNFAHACTEHVGDLLDSEITNAVYQLRGES